MAMKIVGVGSYYKVLSVDAVPLKNANDKLTVALWFNANMRGDDSTRGGIIAMGQTSTWPWNLYLPPPPSTKIRLQIQTVSAGYANSFSTTDINLDQWYHAVFTYDSSLGSANAKLFIEGANAGADQSPAGPDKTLYTLDADFYIGSLNQGLFTHIGKIAEAAAWNVVLSSAEIAALIRGCSARRMRSGNLVAYYSFWHIPAAHGDLSGRCGVATRFGQANMSVANHVQVGPYVVAGG